MDSRIICAHPRLQQLGSSIYTTKIIILRKRLKPGTEEFSGPMGSNPIEYVPIMRNWPAAIAHARHDLEMMPVGQTEKGDWRMVCPFKKSADGKLLIRERDIIIDMVTKQKMLVIWSEDPLNSGLHIYAGLEYGVLDRDGDDLTAEDDG